MDLNTQISYRHGAKLTFEGLKANTQYVLMEKTEYDELHDRAMNGEMLHRHTAEGYEACEQCKAKVAKERAENNRHAISNMERALKTYRDRNRVYGNNYKRFGAIMEALYPKGVFIKTAHEWNRFGIILQKLSKLSRYVTDPHHGHIDSIHDDAVYSFMLEELDSEQAGLDVTPPAPLATYVAPKDVLPNPCEHIYKPVPESMEKGAHEQCVLCGEVK